MTLTAPRLVLAAVLVVGALGAFAWLAFSGTPAPAVPVRVGNYLTADSAGSCTLHLVREPLIPSRALLLEACSTTEHSVTGTLRGCSPPLTFVRGPYVLANAFQCTNCLPAAAATASCPLRDPGDITSFLLIGQLP